MSIKKIYNFFITTIILTETASSDFFINNDKFPTVTDFQISDCDNENNLFYDPKRYLDWLPGCREAIRACPDKKCIGGYKCEDTCKIDEDSCLKYYGNIAGVSNKYYQALWKPDCNLDGTWKSKQCKRDRCFCVDSKGKRIFGDAFKDGAKDMTCACSRRRAELEQTTDAFFVSLHCDSIGNYETLQCSSGQCWCVEPKTGDLISPIMPEKSMTLLPCYNATIIGSQYLRQCESQIYANEKIKDEFLAHNHKFNFENLQCLYDGNFGPTKISGNQVFCVWKDNTNLYSYFVDGKEKQKDMDCICARDKKIYELMGRPHLLQCLDTGSYRPLQSFDDEHYCVDSDGERKSPKVDDPEILVCDDYV